MKKSIILMLAFMFSSAIWADDYTYNYLTFTQADGSQQSVKVSNLQLTFADGTLKATNDDGTITLSLADLASMEFAETPTGITSIDDDRSTPDNASWYTLDGMRLNSAPAQKGIYIRKNGNKTQKVMMP